VNIPFESLWQYVIEHFKADVSGIHGLQHWKRVELYGRLISAHNGADEDVVRLFAIFHDSRRITNKSDKGHGSRGAKLANELRGNLYELDDARFSLLSYACKWHSDGKLSNNPTIGACWDADRIDLLRLEITPEVEFMSTEYGQYLAGECEIKSQQEEY
jgi:uncharacterized protein